MRRFLKFSKKKSSFLIFFFQLFYLHAQEKDPLVLLFNEELGTHLVQKEYVMEPFEKEEDGVEGYVWGKPADIKKLFLDQIIDSSFIFAVLSGDVVQENSKEFIGEDVFSQYLEGMGFQNVLLHKFYWSRHPLLLARMHDENQREHFCAWLGLNTDNGWVVMFSLIYPEKQCEPTSEQLTIWEKFFGNPTKFPPNR